MTRWLRREGLAVVLVVVLATAAVLWELDHGWRDYQDAQYSEVERAAPGEQAVLQGTGYTLTGSEVVRGDSPRGERWEVAPDAALVVLTLDVEPGADPGVEPYTPNLRLLDPSGDGTRWDTASFSDTAWSPPDRYESYVDTDATEPYAVQLGFVVPADRTDGLDLEITSLTSLPRALRLDLGEPAVASPPAR